MSVSLSRTAVGISGWRRSRSRLAVQLQLSLLPTRRPALGSTAAGCVWPSCGDPADDHLSVVELAAGDSDAGLVGRHRRSLEPVACDDALRLAEDVGGFAELAEDRVAVALRLVHGLRLHRVNTRVNTRRLSAVFPTGYVEGSASPVLKGFRSRVSNVRVIPNPAFVRVANVTEAEPSVVERPVIILGRECVVSPVLLKRLFAVESGHVRDLVDRWGPVVVVMHVRTLSVVSR